MGFQSQASPCWPWTVLRCGKVGKRKDAPGGTHDHLATVEGALDGWEGPWTAPTSPGLSGSSFLCCGEQSDVSKTFTKRARLEADRTC
jgi:hypothetical protein